MPTDVLTTYPRADRLGRWSDYGIAVGVLAFYAVIIAVEQRNAFYVPCLIMVLFGVLQQCLGTTAPRWRNNALSSDTKWLLLSFVFFTCSALLMLWVWEMPGRRSKSDLIFLGAIPLLLALRGSRLTERAFFLAVVLGTVVAGYVGVYDGFVLNLPRVLELRNPILPASGVAMTMTLMTMHLAWRQIFPGIGKTLALLVIAAFGLLCVILSGSRGVWLALPIYMAWALLCLHRPNPQQLVALSLVTAAILALLWWWPEVDFAGRWRLAFADWDSYWSGESRDTSVGLRLEFWKSAWDGFLQRPWLGWGTDGYLVMKQQQLESGLIVAAAADPYYSTAHNQFLDAMVKRGVLGLLALLGVLCWPLWMMLKRRRAAHTARHQDQQCLAELGIILIGSTMVYCMTDIFLGLQLSVLFYCVTLMLIIALQENAGIALSSRKNIA